MKKILFVLFILLPIDMSSETCAYGISDADVPETPRNTLLSANPNEHCVTFRYSQLNGDESENWLFIGEDLNNDGNKECFFIAKREVGYGLIIVASDSQQRYNTQFKIPVEEKTVDSCTVSVMFHDFDNDGTKEFILGCVDNGTTIKGIVCRWHEPTKDNPLCFIKAGDFIFNAIPLVDGNTISSNSDPSGRKVHQYIYRNQKLEKY